MINKYESVILVNPNLNKEELNNVKTKIFNLIKENEGKILHEEEYDFVLKKTAYPVKENNKANYLVFHFEVDASFIAELQRIYRLTDNILKFLVVKLEKHDNIILKFKEDGKEYQRRERKYDDKKETTQEEDVKVTEDATNTAEETVENN